MAVRIRLVRPSGIGEKAEAATVGALGAMQLVSMYTYDAADNRIEFEVPNLSNPSLSETFKYSFDDADNITEIEKKIGAGSYSTIETFTSDNDGNLLTRVSGGVTTTYTWDDFNRLAAISTSDNSKKQSHTFGISGFRRKKKDKDDMETTEYAAGLSTEVSKVTSGDTITYLKGGGGIMGFERSSDGATFYFLTDALGSVRDLVNGTGTVVASYEFNETGQKISPVNTGGVESQKTFVGGFSVQDEVTDTGLMMMGHRFYDPGMLGRFLNRDPIGFSGSLNLFEYANSSPIASVDPEGLQALERAVMAPAATPQQKCGQIGTALTLMFFAKVWELAVGNEEKEEEYVFTPTHPGPFQNGWDADGMIERAVHNQRLRDALGKGPCPELPAPGTVWKKYFQTPNGAIEFIADIKYEGSAVILDNVAVYPAKFGSIPKGAAMKEVFGAKNFFREWGQDQFACHGFDRFIFRGWAATNSSRKWKGRPVEATLRF